MKSLFFAALFALGVAVCAAESTPWPQMTSGRYDIKLDGLLCQVCARLVSEETSKLKEVAGATTDLDSDTLTVTVRPGRELPLSRLRRALSRAAQRAKLGTRYTILSVRYRVAP